MPKRDIMEPDKNGQYDTSKQDADDHADDRANEEIKNVKQVMLQLADQLANIEKGMANKRKREEREEGEKVVEFNMEKNEMHVIPVNTEKKTDPSATAYAPVNLQKNDGYGHTSPH